LLGDGLMAFFNVPVKREDHVARAVRVAFEIQEGVNRINARHGNELVLNVGIGIATGTALATNMGSASCRDYTLVGDTINIASRLQVEAAAGEVVLTQEAYAAVSAAFPHGERREYQLKGIERAIVAYAVGQEGH